MDLCCDPFTHRRRKTYVMPEPPLVLAELMVPSRIRLAYAGLLIMSPSLILATAVAIATESQRTDRCLLRPSLS